jgi:predicted MFS family arabinose efflux permease
MGPFIAIIFIEAFSGTAFYRFGPLQVSNLGGDAAMLGLGSALAAYVEVPFMLNVRQMIERIGLRRTFALSTMLMGCITASVGILDSALAITSLRLLEGASFATSLMCAVEIIDRLVPRRLHATGQSLYYSAGTIGAAVGGVVAGVVFAQIGATPLFLGGGLALICTALLALRVLPRSATLAAADRAHGGQ